MFAARVTCLARYAQSDNLGWREICEVTEPGVDGASSNERCFRHHFHAHEGRRDVLPITIESDVTSLLNFKATTK